MCLFYFFMDILSLWSRCCEDNVQTRKFMFKHNQYAAVKLRLIHYQHTRKQNDSIPLSFLTVIPHIHRYGTTDDFKMSTDSTRKSFRYWIFFSSFSRETHPDRYESMSKMHQYSVGWMNVAETDGHSCKLPASRRDRWSWAHAGAPHHSQ